MTSRCKPFRWDCEKDGCFNDLCRLKFDVFSDCFPGKMNFTNVDGLVEVNNHFLFLEWKHIHKSLPLGQQLLFERLTALSPRVTVVIVVGDAKTMAVNQITVVKNGTVSHPEQQNLDDLKSRIRRWAINARQQSKGRKP